MGGSNRSGGRSQETAPAETATETAGHRRAGTRTANTKKPASSKSRTVTDKSSRRKDAQRSGARSGASGAPASDTASPRATSAEVAGLLPVREDEEQWTPEELDEVRTELEREVAGLRQEIERAESAIADRLADPSDGAGDDQADTGAKTFEREHEMSLANNARDLLGQNERAIGRIESGTYGVCETCGNPIGKARLQAFPRAALCVTCKQREERR